MMGIKGRIFPAAITACILLLLFSASTIPASGSTEAGHAYVVAQKRLAQLKKSPKQKKYRSYWIDSIRAFESIQEEYPTTSQAIDSCFDRAAVYIDLYNYNRRAKDALEAEKSYSKCQESYPSHARVPEALYWDIVVTKDVKRNKHAALATFKNLAKTYPGSSWTDKARRKLGIGGAKASAIKKRRKRTDSEIRRLPEAVIAAQPKEPGAVTSIRYWSGGAYTRIVIDQDRPLRFQAQELKKPDRLVFDILNSRISDSIGRAPVPVNDGILKQVRASQFDPSTVRVVLDLASLKSYMAFPLREPERLVIDVTGEGTGDSDNGPDTPQTGAEQATAAAVSDIAQAPDQKAVRGTNAKLSLSRQLGLKIRTIAIDAGHGGHDPGAIGKRGLKEKNVTLDVAKRLAALVKKRLDCKVVMTRDSDEFIRLEDRPAIAKTKGADLFVSIHVNANRRRKARGIETYIQSLRASDRDAMATAAFENATSTKTLSQLGNELDRILKDLAKANKQDESVELAHYVQSSLVNTMRPVKGHVVNLGVKKAFFYVLVNTEMPSILAEVGFISNPQEENLLRKESYRQKIAEALFHGVKKFVESRNPAIAGL